ncbi:hypothetical protein [Microbacterium terricola]|uniref:Lipoprotein n=1 Tax=Microbacterium terricola TaxID=344163 RepID=A0ABM8DZD4_9MICO|nr:hypothetical protein [Microbacterium terricola]UYK41181.1 hypothetical protein OAU46_05965 [Microbacterium terricola]BDV31048.1 hypothetical protein Microterr_17080 [Microbacterium terricola]
MSTRHALASTVALAAVIGVVFGLGGCAADDSEAGFGLPTLSPEESAGVLDAAGPAAVDGALQVETNGCFMWRADGAPEDGAWIVWPEGARQDADVVVLSSGDRVGSGDGILGEGDLVTLSDLPSGADPDSYFGSFGAFCGADERGVIVLERADAPAP